MHLSDTTPNRIENIARQSVGLGYFILVSVLLYITWISIYDSPPNLKYRSKVIIGVVLFNCYFSK